MSEEEAIVKTYVLFPEHINLIDAKAASMGRSSASAALRSIVEEWAAAQDKAHSVLESLPVVEMNRQ